MQDCADKVHSFYLNISKELSSISNFFFLSRLFVTFEQASSIRRRRNQITVYISVFVFSLPLFVPQLVYTGARPVKIISVVDLIFQNPSIGRRLTLWRLFKGQEKIMLAIRPYFFL